MENKLSLLALLFVVAVQANPAADHNATVLYTMELEEALNLHHLLEGYNSILYRYHLSPFKKNENWNYEYDSNRGRPDRLPTKISEVEAIKEMNNVDKIFPIYGKYFNVSDFNESDSFNDILKGRIRNIEEALAEVRDELEGNSTARLRVNLQTVMSFVFFVNILNLFA